MTEETKCKISETLKGRTFSEETKKKMSDSKKEHPVSEETKRKISETLTGRQHTEEEKQKIKDAMSNEETKKKLSESLTGRQHTEEEKQKIKDAMSNKETKKKLSESHKGQIVTEETKKKLSESMKGKNKGKTHTEETKQKLRISTMKHLEEIGFVYPNIGKNEKQILDYLGEELCYNIERQRKVGPYHLDGYIVELNLAIEVDELYHEDKDQKEKDVKREEYIKQELGCEFFRIKDSRFKKEIESVLEKLRTISIYNLLCKNFIGGLMDLDEIQNVKIDKIKLDTYITGKTENIKKIVDNGSTDFKVGFDMGVSYTSLLSSIREYFSLKSIKSPSEKQQNLIKFIEGLQKQFFNEILEVNDFIIKEEK